MSATAILSEDIDIKQNFNNSFQIKHNLIIQDFIIYSKIFSQVYIQYVILNILNQKQEKEFDRLVVLENWLENIISLLKICSILCKTSAISY
jgi:hypothetical protein